MLIHLKEVSIGYSKNKILINKINLNIPAYSWCAIIGRNGVGKSCLVKTILNEVPVVSGDIIRDRDIFYQNRYVGYLPQVGNLNLPPLFTIWHLLINSIGLHEMKSDFSEKEKDSIVQSMADLLSITHLLRCRVCKLSGGEMQKVRLAQLFINEFRVLILDEPFNSLDHFSKVDIVHKLCLLYKMKPFNLFIISHDFHDVEEHFDTIFHLKNQSIHVCNNFKECIVNG